MLSSVIINAFHRRKKLCPTIDAHSCREELGFLRQTCCRGITGSILSATTPTTNHVDYVHVNPLKHGYVKRVEDWPYSTFHRYVAKGIYPVDWCGDINSVVGGDE